MLPTRRVKWEHLLLTEPRVSREEEEEEVGVDDPRVGVCRHGRGHGLWQLMFDPQAARLPVVRCGSSPSRLVPS